MRLLSENRTVNLVRAALFAALTCAATMVLRIPSPTGGYVNCGDVMVLLSGLLLGPCYGAAAAGIGSALVDLFGYAHYVPGTLVIKGLMAVIVCVIAGRSQSLPRVILGEIAAELFMVAGYFLYAAVFLGYGLGALASIPGNLVQGLCGAVLGTALFLVLQKTPYMKRGKKTC